jgi:succinyl-diaminopimelate desuccinylase
MAIERLDEITNKEDQDLVKLLQDLIRIPSWVDKTRGETKHNENEVVEYLESWLKKNTGLSVTRQKLQGERYNLIASKGKPDIVFLGHTDTVAPSEGSEYNQLAAEIHDGKIWGRGSTDMKSGIAATIQALSLSPDTENVWAMFYADEEYDFLGMKGLIHDYSDLKPKLLISSDGSDLEIGHGCRGLIEFRARVKGVAGHPAKGNGINAINGVFTGMTELRSYLDDYKHPVMGGTSLNLAYLFGGQQIEKSFTKKGKLKKLGQEGNVIPNLAEFVVDIRPSSPDLNVENILKKLKDEIETTGCTFETVKVRHNLGAWYTDLSDIKEFADLAVEATKQKEIGINKPGESGYLDLQMLWEATGRPKSFMFGGGEGSTAHKADEHIKIENLIKERDFFKKVLEFKPK